MTRVAIYARYSSDLQSETSIDDQIRLCRETIERDKGTVVEVFTDYAISGGSLLNRPGMQAVLAAPKAVTSKLSSPRLSTGSAGIKRTSPESSSASDMPTFGSSLSLRARSANCMWASKVL